MSQTPSYENLKKRVDELEKQNSQLQSNVKKYRTLLNFSSDDSEKIDWEHASKGLEERNQFIETILKNLPIGIAVNTIQDGQTTYVNKKFEGIYGWPKEDLYTVESFFNKVFPDPAYRKEIRTKVMDDIASGDSDRMIWNDLKITTKKGDHRIVLAINIPLFEQNIMISTVQDITENKKLQESLRQAQKMESIGNLAGGIAHDFNNILFPIIGLSELLMDDLPEGSPEYENVSEILNAGRRGSDLIKQILAFSRQYNQDFTPVYFHQIIDDVIKLCRAIIPADIDLHTDFQQDCGMVMSDPSQLHQVAMNLITNAYHAIEPNSGCIFVQLKEVVILEDELMNLSLAPARYARLTVSDTGTGIDPRIIDKIFDPYFTTKEQGKGTGLGLAVVHGIIRKHHGDIKVYSEPGKGSTFNVYIPVMEKALVDIPEKQSDHLPMGSEKILLVDDEVSILRLGKLMLERLGYQVTIFSSSTDALTAFQQTPGDFDLVISDMNMPDLTGDQLAKKLLSIRGDIPIIICTGFSERIDQNLAEKIGIRGFLMKPIIQRDMAGTIRSILDK